MLPRRWARSLRGRWRKLCLLAALSLTAAAGPETFFLSCCCPSPQPKTLRAHHADDSTSQRASEAPLRSVTAAAAAVLLSFALLSPLGGASAAAAEPVRHVYSVGDLHGDYVHSCEILRALGVMGKDGEWTGGNSILVQTGDVTDRGEETGPIFRELFRLQDEAPKSGGEVILLLGNHELMNLAGDFRYATPRETASLLSADAPAVGGRAQAFSQEGWLGKAIRERLQALAVLGPRQGLSQPVLFVHAGLKPEFAKQFAGGGSSGAELAERLNSDVQRLLARPASELRAESSALLGNEGPFWTRKLALGDEASACEAVRETLDVVGASRMVVGHTPQTDGQVHERCAGHLVLGDTLISKYFTGESHPSAVEVFPDGSATAIYPQSNERVNLRAVSAS